VKMTQLNERTTVHYSFDVSNVSNTPSFDIPSTTWSRTSITTSCRFRKPLPVPPCTPNETSGFYNCPFGLGNVNKTIGSARQIQMSLSLKFESNFNPADRPAKPRSDGLTFTLQWCPLA
jgi:hypothetical protein